MKTFTYHFFTIFIKINLLSIILLGLALQSTAQTIATIKPISETPKGAIKGTLKDKTGINVVGASIWLKGTAKGTTSDANGRFELKNVPEGEYTLQIQAVNIQLLEQVIQVKAQETLQLELNLNESIQELAEIQILESRSKELESLPEVEGTSIFAGKKSEVINFAGLDANFATNNTRQIFGKTPGISIWENDGSGLQVGVASRGLSPNRSWEFNVRQNGYDISSDPFGYPEAYYNPPMDAVERIQVVRGASSLQFGPQFGGLLNYIVKRGSANRPIVVESQQTIGSFGLFSSYNSVGGTKGKFNYFAYYQHRNAEGWRQNSRYTSDNLHFNLNYALTQNLKIGIEYTYSDFQSQQAGGLTDAQFAQDARQSFRARNWFGVPWHVLNLNVDYQVSEKTKLNLKVFGLLGERNSVGFVNAITVADTINPNLKAYNPRQIDRDFYKNLGAELRLLSDYQLFGKNHTLASGLRFFRGNTQRQQLGRGSTGSGFDLTLQDARFSRDLNFTSNNFSAFVENIFRVNKNWTITPGVRFEHLQNDAQGRLRINSGVDENIQPQNQARNFVLLGIGSEYKIKPNISLYANYSQAYRPVLFSDLTPAAVTGFEIDPNLQDAQGFNADLGVRGNWKEYLFFDVSGFYLNYQNRIGQIATSPTTLLRTNLGTTHHRGLEAYLELNPMKFIAEKPRWGNVNLFASLSFIEARYADFVRRTYVNNQLVESNLKDKKVENAPQHIHRLGLNYTLKGFSLTWQMSIVGATYSDADNTETASANGQNGKIPAYRVMDLSGSYRFLDNYNIRFGVNNLADARYFTRRAGGYPGPGLLPSDGRNFYVSFGIRL
ncbi:MAG: TonB-dependent receptor [Microscillaceae bacterium]|jgi:Fe(3+) dicitrate transport protein|nr:TonB-dependent receptor [Microscillaceae bacterium]